MGRQAGKDRAAQKTSQRQPPRAAKGASSANVASSGRSRTRKPSLVWMYRVLLTDA
jgi:hypothetical protein